MSTHLIDFIVGPHFRFFDIIVYPWSSVDQKDLRDIKADIEKLGQINREYKAILRDGRLHVFLETSL